MLDPHHHILSDALFVVTNGMGGKKVTSGNLDGTSHVFSSHQLLVRCSNGRITIKTCTFFSGSFLFRTLVFAISLDLFTASKKTSLIFIYLWNFEKNKTMQFSTWNGLTHSQHTLCQAWLVTLNTASQIIISMSCAGFNFVEWHHVFLTLNLSGWWITKKTFRTLCFFETPRCHCKIWQDFFFYRKTRHSATCCWQNLSAKNSWLKNWRKKIVSVYFYL